MQDNIRKEVPSRLESVGKKVDVGLEIVKMSVLGRRRRRPPDYTVIFGKLHVLRVSTAD